MFNRSKNHIINFQIIVALLFTISNNSFSHQQVKTEETKFDSIIVKYRKGAPQNLEETSKTINSMYSAVNMQKGPDVPEELKNRIRTFKKY